MANQRVLVQFLRQQGKNRQDQLAARRADRNPNGQMLGKLGDEAKMFEQAAKIVEQADLTSVTQTSEEFERQRLSTAKKLVTTDTPLVSAKVTANGKRIGRPPKMTREQIEAAQSGPAVAAND